MHQWRQLTGPTGGPATAWLRGFRRLADLHGFLLSRQPAKLAGLTSHWTRIVEQLETRGPWILKIYKGPTAPVLMLAAEQPT